MRKLSINAILIFGADVGAKALNFLAVVYLVRVLLDLNWGKIVVGLYCLTYAGWLADFGVSTLGSRELAKPRELREMQLVDVLALRLVQASAVWIIAQIVLLFLDLDATLYLIVQVYLLSLFATALFLEWYYQAIQEFRLLTISRVVAAALYVLPLYLLVRGPEDVHLVPWIYLAATAATTTLLFFWKRREDRLSLQLLSLPRLGAIMRRASVIGAASFFGQTIMALPPLVVAAMYSESDAGVLAIAVKVIMLLLMVDRVFALLFLPAVTRKWIVDRERMTDALLPALRLLTVIGCSLSTIVCIFAADLLEVFGSTYVREGAPVLAILSWFITATLMNTFFTFGLIGIGRETPFLTSSIKGGALFVVLLVAMTWLWGVPGTAWAMVIGEFAFTAWLYVAFRKQIPLPFGRDLLLYGTVSAALIGVAYVIGATQIWQLPLYWIAFIGLVYLFKGLRRNELAWLLQR